MNGGGSSSPSALRIPFSSASPSGSNNTNTGRPPLWNNSSQRKVSRLYLYTTLPLQKIIEVVHVRSPEAAPGKESANKKINGLLDKEPRWLHPRSESDMGRRLNELALSPTRSLSSRGSTSARPHAASDPPLLNPDPNSSMKRETGTSPTTLEVPPFHQFPPPVTPSPAAPYVAQRQASRQNSRQAHRSNDQDSNSPLSRFLRRTTFMSSSTQGTQGTTGSLQRVLADYSEPYIRTVKLLVKRFTAPINHRAESMSPVSDVGAAYSSWLSDDDAPPTLPNRPYFLPGDFLNLDYLVGQQPPCFQEAEQHHKRSCLCFAQTEIMDSPFTTANGLNPDAVRLLMSGTDGVDLGVVDGFDNSILHFLAARGATQHLVEVINSDRCGPILNARNTAGQTFLHVLHSSCFLDPIMLSQLLILVTLKGVDINARDHYGRTIFHILLADDAPRSTFNQIAPSYDLAKYMKRDAFNVTPRPELEPMMGFNRIYTQRMDLDPPPSDSQFTFTPEMYADAAVAKESELVAFVRSATVKPGEEYADGRNGLHCLAAATLSYSSIVKRYGFDGADRKRKKNQEPRDLDSSTEKMNLRLQLLDGLLQAGVDPNHYDSEGNTPLMAFAAQLPEDEDYKTGPEILSRLIAAGAEVNARNRAGETALHIAVRCGRKLAMRTLVQHGANVHARDAAGRGMLQVTDVKMRGSRGYNPKEYAHFEACRAWLSGKGMAVQEPSVLQEWGPVARVNC
ncbi:hypothetical protein BGZ61DRAFT_207436 [Ilyonectria robusta]|uniref:uncharacterized protein n=1 Tax=Ilyonectria robusta TaxID=1079257 RepID=UPI001E8E087F|nr:uncharacterized protein BGZ61DRAFT_207436 [Ilyonectria robusta]KAH8714174.1 hypothetical protein BGZ61DRAFT_207436 [Ilyonectria robusta]